MSSTPTSAPPRGQNRGKREAAAKLPETLPETTPVTAPVAALPETTPVETPAALPETTPADPAAVKPPETPADAPASKPAETTPETSKAAPRAAVTVKGDDGKERTYMGPIRTAADGTTVINAHDQYRRAYADRIKSLGEHQLHGEQIARMGERAARISDETAHWIDVAIVTTRDPVEGEEGPQTVKGATLSDVMARIGADLKIAGALLAALPEGWKPPAKPQGAKTPGKAAGKVEIGAIVAFKATVAADYCEDLGVSDAAGAVAARMTVQAVNGSRVRVRVGDRPAFWAPADGVKVITPAPAAPAATTQAPAATTQAA